MKRLLMALSIATALSFALTAPINLHAVDNTASTQTTQVMGTVVVTKDKSGNTSLVSLKTDNGSLLVPTKAMDSFAPYEGKKVKACCVAQGKALIPLCVTGIVQPQRVPTGRIR